MLDISQNIINTTNIDNLKNVLKEMKSTKILF